MTEVLETTEQATTQTKPKLDDILQREKARKLAIENTKYQAQFLAEQNKLLKAQKEKMELEIEHQEISARSWKAWHDKMFYSIACEKLEPEYKEYQKRVEERMKEEKAKQEEEQKRLQEEAAIPKQGDLTVASLNTNEE